MTLRVENALTITWNRFSAWRRNRHSGEKMYLGVHVNGGYGKRRRVGIPIAERSQHIAVLGKTGTGKTSLLRYMCGQDIRNGHGFAFFDLHGDTTPFLLGLIADEERRQQRDLSSRTILIDPSDRERSVGLNILEAQDEQDAFVEIAELVQILKHRWKLDALGVRTDELLRHSLFVLVCNGMTFLEISPLLTNEEFRARCVRRSPLGESRAYFELRYDQLSDAMQSVYREAILNKVSLYAADPHFRHLLGQRKSTVDLRKAIDAGGFVLFNLEKGRLGDETATLAALLLAKLKHAILGRKTRRLFTLYCDELQNLVAYDSAVDVLLSEARKFGVSVVSANQYLDQYPPAMRAAVMAVSSHVFLQLGGIDAARVSHWLGRGHAVAERLRTLPKQHALAKVPGLAISELRVPDVPPPSSVPLGLLDRVRRNWTRSRKEIDVSIRRLHGESEWGRDVLGQEWN